MRKSYLFHISVLCLTSRRSPTKTLLHPRPVLCVNPILILYSTQCTSTRSLGFDAVSNLRNIDPDSTVKIHKAMVTDYYKI